MKRHGIRALIRCIIISLCIMVYLIPSARAGYSYGLTLFTQNKYTGTKDSPLPNYKLDGNGCCLFSFAHAIQWAKQQSLGNTVIKGLRDKAPPLPNPPGKYCQYAKEKYNLKTNTSCGGASNSNLMKLFNDGYALVLFLSNCDHCVCAIDYIICDAEGNIIADNGKTIPKGCTMYVHIVDSSPATSTNNSKKKGYTRTFYNDVYTINAEGKMKPRSYYSYPSTKYPNSNNASAYWVDMNKKHGSVYIQGGVCGKGITGGWSGHQSLKYNDYGPYFFKYANNGYIYGEPSTSSSSKVDAMKDFVVVVDKQYTGEYSGWLGTKDGKFVREVDLKERTTYDKELDKYTREEFKTTVRPNNDNAGLYYQPYTNSICVYRVNKNTDLSVKAIILNNTNPKHYWLEVNYQNGTYFICANNVHEYFVGPRRFIWTDGTVTVPDGRMEKGKGLNFIATIQASVPLTKVTGIVYDTNNNPLKVVYNGETRTYSKTISFTNPTYTFKLGGSSIDYHLKMGWLNDGAYRFALKVAYKKYKDVTNDTDYPIEEITEPLIEKDFTIGNAKPQSSQSITSITLSNNTLDLQVSGTFNIVPTIAPSDATNKSLSWTSSNTSVATVSNGKITAIGPGTTTITAQANDNSGKKATCTVTVKQPVTSIIVTPNSKVLYLNETANLTAIVMPENASNKEVTWDSSNNNVAVNQSGNITANAVGSATITAKANDGSGKQGTCTVEVRAYVSSITLSGADTINVGSTISLKPSINPGNAFNKHLDWSSSNSSIATVDDNGNVKGLQAGQVTITAVATDRGTISATKVITVNQPVTSITLSGTNNILKGNTQNVGYTIRPANASNQTLSWSADNPTIATVNNGTVTAKAVGTTDIWAHATDGSGVKAKLTIRVLEPVSEITLNGNHAVSVGGTTTISAVVTPSDAYNKELAWTSDQPAIAAVDNYGTVRGLQTGSAVITATAKDGSGVSVQFAIQVVKQELAVRIEGPNLVHAGNTAQLTAVVTSDEPLSDTSVTWSSGNDSVATVNTDGILTAVSNGTTIITATSNAETYYYAQYQVTVDTLVNKITVSGTKNIDAGSTTLLSASVAPATASNKSLTWTSSNVSVAVTDGNGLVTGIREGTATITAAATDGSGVKGTIKVTVYPLPNQITITGEKDLLAGTTAQMTATVLPSNARNKNVTWTSSDTTVATVNSSGLVTAVGNGNAIITAVASGNGNITENHEVTVTTRVSSVTLNAPDRVNAGEMGTITAEVLPETASNQQLNWTSSDEDVAIVDANGNVFGISGGYVIIAATTTDGSDIISEAEIEIYQAVQSVSVDIDPIAYVGQDVNLEAIILPEDASEPYVTWTSNNENVAVIETTCETNGDYSSIHCVGAGVARITATSTDGSNVSGYAYIQVLPYTTLTSNSVTYTLYANGEPKGTIGRVSLTTECSVRVAEEKHGAVWKIEHVSGDYAVALGMNERTFSYNGFALANSVDLVALGINHAGTDVYRVTCTINGQPDSCLVTVNVEEPSSPLPTSVNVPTTTYNGLVGETITVNATPVVTPSTSALPEETERLLVGVESFNRYAQVSTNGETFDVTFSKAGTYSAIVRYSGTNYSYDAYVTFVITTEAGTLPAEVEEIILNNSLLYMLSGETARFDVSISPSAADDAEMIWSSSNNDAVTVAADGTLTAVAPGTATITVAADNGVSASGFVAVVESLLSIDWNPDEVIEVYVGGNSKTVIQRVFLTERASAQLTEAPAWSLKRVDGSNLTLTYEPITATNGNGNTLYGCAIILKSVSDIGTTEYELTCTDGNYSSGTTIKVNANSVENTLPSMVSWQTSTFTGNVNQLLTIYPVVRCWPEGTILPDEVTISFDGDNYWNGALNRNDFTVSRGIITFSFSEPGVYSATCIYEISNMRYLVPVTVRIKDANGNVPVRAMKLTLNENEISVQPGGTYQMNAVVAPADATNKAVSWSSEDPSIALVDAEGVVTGVANGRTNIWCTPADTNCDPVKCVVVVEDVFTVTQYAELETQYLQGDTGYAVAAFELSTGTVKRLENEGYTPEWTLTRVSGNAANVELQERNGKQYIIVTELLAGESDVYRVTCTAGSHIWNGLATLEVTDLGNAIPTTVSIAQSNYTAAVNEEIELDFTPVCAPDGSAVPSGMYASYVGIGDFYDGLVDSYRISVLTARNDTVKVAFRKPGTYILSRYYRSGNLSYVTECAVTVDDGHLSFLKCTDEEPVVYIGGKSGIASTCIISDTSIEELYGGDIVWNAERLSGDCMTVALRADQSSASLYVVNAKEWGEETWRVSCTFKDITDYADIVIRAVEARTELPETVELYQTEFSGMIGNAVSVPLAVQCLPDGTGLPSTAIDAWSFSADGNTTAHAEWVFAEDHMQITFSESGYYGGRLNYKSGNVDYSFPISFAITDEESVLVTPTHMDVSINKDAVTVYPEGESNVAIIKAILSDSLDAYSLSSIAAYAERNGAVWSLETVTGTACTLSIQQINAASVQIVLDSITGTGDVTYRVSCSVGGNIYSAQGAVHVAADSENRPNPAVRQTYFTAPTGTVLTIDASFYDRQSNIRLCEGKDSVWDNADALAAMGFEYETDGNLWLPTFYEPGTYITTITNMIGNLVCSQEIKIAAYTRRNLPGSPSSLTFPRALHEIDDEAFMNVNVNLIDLRGTNVTTIGIRAFANNRELMRVYIPSSVTSIGADAFSGCSDFIIICVQGSFADEWAQANGYPAVYNPD